MQEGRPPIFEDPEKMRSMAADFFNECIGKKLSPTITGLCLHLGFESRQSFYDYEKRDEFSYIVKRLRMMIENVYEQRLFSNANAGAIFGLKNFGWTDKQEYQHSGSIDGKFSKEIVFLDGED